MIDGVSIVGQLCATAIIVEDQVLVQTRVGSAHVKVGIGHTLDGLFASGSHARPSTVQVVNIAPHVERDSVPTGFVHDKHGIAIVFHSNRLAHLLDTARGHMQIDVAIDREVEVGQL